MRKILGLAVLSFLSGCVSTPQIAQNETSASVLVSTSTLEQNSIHPDETIFVRIFTPDQSLQNDRPLSVTTLKPNQSSGNFYLNSDTAYRIQLFSMNSGTFSSSSCSALLDVTPSAKSNYHIQFNVNEPNEKCSLIFKAENKELVKETFVKNKIYSIPVPIPVSL
ncbi:hypothetical protein [Ferrimonas senticii]|uniref:hypothetical protein n=1 Tax=Ferrimonas senticii TaxID=394566 RepID=UPI0012EC1771|nr:hypothetical protein [Ferrimonas senticii]